jgi:Family of unknown function (DUF6152)
MKKTNAITLALISVGLLVSAPLFAHHGAAEFSTKDKITLKGVVTEFAFTNPHVQVYFDVRNEKGETERWLGDLPAPNTLIRAGWNKRTLKPGDSVTVSGYPAHRGVHAIWIGKLIGPDGMPIPLSED